jgi:hypothetical protein
MLGDFPYLATTPAASSSKKENDMVKVAAK